MFSSRLDAFQAYHTVKNIIQNQGRGGEGKRDGGLFTFYMDKISSKMPVASMSWKGRISDETVSVNRFLDKDSKIPKTENNWLVRRKS